MSSSSAAAAQKAPRRRTPNGHSYPYSVEPDADNTLLSPSVEMRSSAAPAAAISGASSSSSASAVSAAVLALRPTTDLGRVFQMNLHAAMLGFRRQLENTSPPAAEPGQCEWDNTKSLIGHTWKAPEQESDEALPQFPPVVITINNAANTYRTIAEVPLLFESQHRALSTIQVNNRRACTMTLENFAAWMTHPHIPHRGSLTSRPPVFGIREYASRSGPRLPWNDDIVRGAGDLAEVIRDNFSDVDITTRTRAVRMLNASVNSFCQTLLQVTLPTVSDVICSGMNPISPGGAMLWSREAVEQMVAAAPVEDFASYTSQLVSMVITELDTNSSRNADIAQVGYMDDHLGGTIATLSKQLFSRLIRRYIHLRYSGVAVVYDGIEALCGYLKCPETVAYSSFIPNLATKNQYSLDHDELFDFKMAASQGGAQRDPLPTEVPMCYQTCYLISRAHTDPLLAEGIASLNDSSEATLRAMAAMVHALYAALSWRWICLQLIFPMFNLSEHLHVTQTPSLTPFGSRELSSNLQNSSMGDLTPRQIVLLYAGAFGQRGTEVTISLNATNMGDVPRTISYQQRALPRGQPGGFISSSSSAVVAAAAAPSSSSAMAAACSRPAPMDEDEHQDESDNFTDDDRAQQRQRPPVPTGLSAAVAAIKRADERVPHIPLSRPPPLKRATQTTQPEFDDDDDDDDDEDDDFDGLGDVPALHRQPAVPGPALRHSPGSTLSPFDILAADTAPPAPGHGQWGEDTPEDEEEVVTVVGAGRKRPLEPCPVPRKKISSSDELASSARRIRYNVKDRLRRRYHTLIQYAEKIANRKKNPRGRSGSTDYRDYITSNNRVWATGCIRSGSFFIVPAVTNPALTGKMRGGPRGARAETTPMNAVPPLLVVPPREGMPALVIDEQRSALALREFVVDGMSPVSADTFVRLIKLHTVHEPEDLAKPPKPPQGRSRNHRNTQRFNITAVLAIHFYWCNWCQGDLPRLAISKDGRHKLVKAATKLLGLRDARCQIFTFARNSPYWPLANQIDPVLFRPSDCFSKMSAPYLHKA